MSEAHEKTRIRQLEDAAAHWEHKYTNARQHNRNLEERCKGLEAEVESLKAWSDAANLTECQDRIRVLEAELAEFRGRLATLCGDMIVAQKRNDSLRAALREATWLLHEDVPDDPPVSEAEHYARKAAWNVELTRLGIPTNCYESETTVSRCPVRGTNEPHDQCTLEAGHPGYHVL